MAIISTLEARVGTAWLVVSGGEQQRLATCAGSCSASALGTTQRKSNERIFARTSLKIRQLHLSPNPVIRFPSVPSYFCYQPISKFLKFGREQMLLPNLLGSGLPGAGPPGTDVLINTIAELALRTRLQKSELVQVRVNSSALELLSGTLGGVKVRKSFSAAQNFRCLKLALPNNFRGPKPPAARRTPCISA